VSRVSKLCGMVLVVSLAWLADAGAQWVPGFTTGRWIWEEQRDKITDQVIYVGYVNTLRTSIGGSSDINGASVLVYCSGNEAAVVFLWSRSAAGTKNLSVAFRFEGQPGHVTKARYVKRTKQETTDLGDVRLFLDGLAKSDRLYVRATSDLYGTSEAGFRYRGGAEIVNRLRAACPILAATS
jgi:hypothetical protein